MRHTDGFTKLEYSSEGTSLKLYDIKKDHWATLVSPDDLKPEGTRITSYNVCYTKLLRLNAMLIAQAQAWVLSQALATDLSR